jgi:hypothetical protein
MDYITLAMKHFVLDPLFQQYLTSKFHCRRSRPDSGYYEQYYRLGCDTV